MKYFLSIILFIAVSLISRAQCNWTTVSYESYEYTTTIPYLIPGTTYQSTPQTYVGCVRSGSRGMYMNIVNGYIGLLYSQQFNNLCVGQKYRFTFSTRDAFTSTNNLTFNVYDNSNNLLSTINVLNNSVWQDISMPEFMAATTSIRFEIVTNIAGASGNDVGFDDLRLQQCQPFPSNYSLNQCSTGTTIDLYNLINSPVLSTNGTWTGPGTLANGYLGTFDQNTGINGTYTYTIDGGGSCPDSVAIFAIGIVSNPDITAPLSLDGCESLALPTITGTNLYNSAYYSGPNGTGTNYPVGTNFTNSQTIYAYSGITGCSDEIVIPITINQPYHAGGDFAFSSCNTIGSVDLNTWLNGNFDINGVWTETTVPPSGALSGSVFSSDGLPGNEYTFNYTVPANGACTEDVALFTIAIQGNITVDLGNDTTFCQGESIVLNPGDFDSYLWDNNSTNPTRTVSNPGTYYVEVGVFGDNVISNGDFEQGNTGFTTDYSVGTGGTWGQLSNAGTYAISSSPNLVHNNFMNCEDHTESSGTKMLIVNGSGTPNTSVWCQTVSVQPSTNYSFSTWVSSALNDANVAQLQFNINNSPLGAVFSPSPQGCDWSQFFENWYSGMNTSAQICIVNQNTTNSGNDFMIDDIVFAPVCYGSDTIVVANYPAPVISATANDTICAGEISNSIIASSTTPNLTYTWNPGGIVNPVLTVSPMNSTVYTVIAETPEGCVSNAVSRTVLVKQSPIIDLVIDENDTICFGESVTITVQTNVPSSYLWQPSGNTLNTEIITPSSSTGVTVVATSANGCMSDSTIQITVIPPLEVQIEGNTLICMDGSSVLTAIGNQGGMNYIWQPSGSVQNQISVGSSNEGWIYVTGSFMDCAQATDSVELIIYSAPVVNPISDVEICPNEPIEVSASTNQAGSTVYWLPSGVSGNTQTIVTSDDAIIYVFAENNGCISDTVAFNIMVNLSCQIDVPNVFTPNNDGDNDFFQLINTDGIESLECVIINRWGNVIVEFNEISFLWDGLDKSGDVVTEGTYFYKINAVSKAGEEFEKAGTVQLFR